MLNNNYQYGAPLGRQTKGFYIYTSIGLIGGTNSLMPATIIYILVDSKIFYKNVLNRAWRGRLCWIIDWWVLCLSNLGGLYYLHRKIKFCHLFLRSLRPWNFYRFQILLFFNFCWIKLPVFRFQLSFNHILLNSKHFQL